jgi:hypothetical protein
MGANLMTDYNDGEWHGWDGGECPVHPKSVIKVFYVPSGSEQTWSFEGAAGDKDWGHPFLFRVINPYLEPREAYATWHIKSGTWGSLHTTKGSAKKSASVGYEIIRFVEAPK